MLYGNLIFIKRTGGDGSKFPVTERDIKIGRSEDCLIRIYNTEVAPEHCQLIIEENGQTTLRNLSNKTVLNGKPLGQGDVTLCHGDIFKVGERLARWEYLPTSKYYKKLLSPTGHLLAVVVPKKRSRGEEATPGTSVQVSVLNNTPLGKGRYSKIGSSASAVKVRKSSGTDLICKTMGDLPKFLTGRHSLKTTKLLFHGAKVKERKSISGTLSSKTPKGKFGGKSRKSTLPFWKMKIVSPSQQKSTSRNSLTNSRKKSAKSPKNGIKTPLKDILESSQKLSLSVTKRRLKTPQIIKDSGSYGVLTKSASKSISNTPLKAGVQSPSLKSEICIRSTRSFSKSPSPKKTSPKSVSKIVLSTPIPIPPNPGRLVHSESKLNSLPPSFKKLRGSVTQEGTAISEGLVSDTVMESPVRRTLLNESSPVTEKGSHKSVNGSSEKKIAGKTGKISKKSLLQKHQPKSPKEVKMKTPRKNIVKQAPESFKQRTSTVSTSEVALEVIAKTPLPIHLNSVTSSNRVKCTPRKSARSTPIKKTGKLVRSAGKIKSPTLPSRKISIRQNETIPHASPPGISVRESEVKEASLKKSGCSSEISISSPRGVRRKLSPSSSAERAAKKLKTSSPIKPDKNKKAALLVLGKANRKQLPSQNMKVLLKQKIVKKAIKQSTAALTSQKVESRAKIAAKLKKGLHKTALKSKKKSAGKEKSLHKISPSKSPKTPDASNIHCPVKEKGQEITLKGNALLETSQLTAFKAQASPTLHSTGKEIETQEKSQSKQNKQSEDPFSITLSKSSASTSSPSDKFYKTAESYLFNSNRRSKRLSSKNETGRPDFIELSPRALGLIPKNINVFKTPKDNKRKSSSLVTPKDVRSTGIIKSASTSKIGNRKSVRFSSKDVSCNSSQNPVVTEKVDLDFSSYHTPDVTVDIFVSPLGEKSSATKKDVSECMSMSTTGDISKTSITGVRRSGSGTNTCVRKLLQSPQARSSPLQKSLSQSSRTTAVKSTLSNEHEGKLKAFPESKSSNSDSSDLRDVRKLFLTPKTQKSPKNDLSDVRGVKKLMRTPKAQKSPKNDLTDVRGVKKLLRTPKAQKSPKNDLTDVRGVKKLMRTPKSQKSPKNDLSDVRGVKKLMRTPKSQKSPKNDLSDVRGVKKLMRTPKAQKSPKNDLTDVRGVKKLLRTPKAQKSPKNDLTDVRGVKKLMRTPKAQKSPKNDLTDVRGVKKLLRTPKAQKSPKNDLTNVDGLKELLRSPRVQKCPKSDLSDLRGIKKLFTASRGQKSPKTDLLEKSLLGNLFDSPGVEKLASNSTAVLMKVPVHSLKLERNSIAKMADVVGLNQLLISKSPVSISKSNKAVSRKPHVNEYKAIRGRCTIYSTSEGPKNDLSDLTGVRELFSRHKPISDYNISLTGVTELFSLPENYIDSKSKKRKPKEKSIQSTTERKSRSKTTFECKEEVESEVKKPLTRSLILRKAIEDETRKRATKRKAPEKVEDEKPAKRNAVKKIKTIETKKTPDDAKKSEKITKKETKSMGKKSRARIESGSAECVKEEVKRSRRRKVLFEEDGTPPPKPKRKLLASQVTSSLAVETSRGAASRSKKEAVPGERVRVKSVDRDIPTTGKTKTSSKAIKSSTKRVQKVQNRSQSSSKTNSFDRDAGVSPRKTRSGKSGLNKTDEKKVYKTQSKTVQKKVAPARRKKSPVLKRSTRRT